MIATNSEMIEFTTAEKMAAAFASQSTRIFEALDTLADASRQLSESFADSYDFGFAIEYRSERNASRERIADGLKRAAWKAILDKLNIWKTMSSKRVEELQAALTNCGRYRNRETPPTEWPDITPENVVQVAAGYASSATEFLEEAVAEEYDFWKPSKSHHDYKRNSEFALNRRIIRPYVISRGYGKCPYRCNYSYQSHVTALDNIFHMLAGRKGVETYGGPLKDAIETSATGEGETEFFRFRCHKNGNLHLEFKRLDLLELFNKIAGRNRLPGKTGAA